MSNDRIPALPSLLTCLCLHWRGLETAAAIGGSESDWRKRPEEETWPTMLAEEAKIGA
jgi:hypothetical protein